MLSSTQPPTPNRNQRRGHVNGQKVAVDSQEERALTRNQTLWELDLRIWASRTARNKFLLCKAPTVGAFCCGGPT